MQLARAFQMKRQLVRANRRGCVVLAHRQQKVSIIVSFTNANSHSSSLPLFISSARPRLILSLSLFIKRIRYNSLGLCYARLFVFRLVFSSKVQRRLLRTTVEGRNKWIDT